MDRKNHWWNIILFVNSNGISTQTMTNGPDDDIRNKTDAEKLLLDFLESTYAAWAKLAGWKIDELNVPALTEL